MRKFPRGGSPDPPRKANINVPSAVGLPTRRAECSTEFTTAL